VSGTRTITNADEFNRARIHRFAYLVKETPLIVRPPKPPADSRIARGIFGLGMITGAFDPGNCAGNHWLSMTI